VSGIAVVIAVEDVFDAASSRRVKTVYTVFIPSGVWKIPSRQHEAETTALHCILLACRRKSQDLLFLFIHLAAWFTEPYSFVLSLYIG
jgi:hypothetical protein